MEHRRMAWTACVVAISTLGLGGILAQGCGGDDSAAPAGTAGSAGAGGSGGGGTAGKAGSAGSTAGTGGTKTDGGSDARPDVNYQAICSSTADSGSSCSDTCICTNCAQQAVTCFADPRCRNLVDCANRNNCNDPDILKATACAQTKCPTELGAAGSVGIAEATGLAMCVSAAMCDSKCSGEGGAPDATPDNTTTDGPRADVTPDATPDTTPPAEASTADAPSESTTVDTGPIDALVIDSGSDATPD